MGVCNYVFLYKIIYFLIYIWDYTIVTPFLATTPKPFHILPFALIQTHGLVFFFFSTNCYCMHLSIHIHTYILVYNMISYHVTCLYIFMTDSLARKHQIHLCEYFEGKLKRNALSGEKYFSSSRFPYLTVLFLQCWGLMGLLLSSLSYPLVLCHSAHILTIMMARFLRP